MFASFTQATAGEVHNREDVLAREKGWARGEMLDREQEQKAGWAREEVQGKEEMIDREEGKVNEEMVAREEDQREVAGQGAGAVSLAGF